MNMASHNGTTNLLPPGIVCAVYNFNMFMLTYYLSNFKIYMDGDVVNNYHNTDMFHFIDYN